jgi:hypothetical protein
MTPQLAQTNRELLKRAQLTGDEAFAYVAVCQALEAEMKAEANPQSEGPPEGAEDVADTAEE